MYKQCVYARSISVCVCVFTRALVTRRGSRRRPKTGVVVSVTRARDVTPRRCKVNTNQLRARLGTAWKTAVPDCEYTRTGVEPCGSRVCTIIPI